jgi:uncharacterized spore protein YtfJ
MGKTARVDMNEAMTAARDAMTVRRVFGEPCERDGVTVIPAAVVVGGMGGGSGQRGGDTGDTGDGGGFGVIAVPAGAYSIRDGQVRWHPAVSVNLLVAAATVVGLTWLVGRSRTARARAAQRNS